MAMSFDWTHINCAIRRAVERTDHDDYAERAMHHMLNVVEARPELMPQAIAWVERIATHGYLPAGPWTAWYPNPGPPPTPAYPLIWIYEAQCGPISPDRMDIEAARLLADEKHRHAARYGPC